MLAYQYIKGPDDSWWYCCKYINDWIDNPVSLDPDVNLPQPLTMFLVFLKNIDYSSIFCMNALILMLYNSEYTHCINLRISWSN